MSPRKPLPARSTVLSVLLGAHPAELSAAELVGVGRHVGIAESTLRVALTRAVAAGDLVRTDAGYALGDRLVERQRRQDLAVEHAVGTWDGTWHQAVVVGTGRSAPERAALRRELSAERFGELRDGVWMRPANVPAPDVRSADLSWMVVSRVDDPATIAAGLWDLEGWARHARQLLDELAATSAPAVGLAVAADIVRHLVADPLLPVQLLPSSWPGDRLREAYASYQRSLIADSALIASSTRSAGTNR